MPLPGASLPSYPASIPLSTRSLNHLADLIRTHRHQRRSRWRRLDPGRQALVALAHLRNGDTLTRLAAGFQVGVATAWRYIREAITLLAAAANDLHQAMTRIRLLAYVILDGTLIPIDRVHDQTPYVATLKTWKILTKLRCSPSGRPQWCRPSSFSTTSKTRPTKEENAQPCRPTLVMSCRARTRHTYDGTRRDGRMT
jgi:hypothetical protein